MPDTSSIWSAAAYAMRCWASSDTIWTLQLRRVPDAVEKLLRRFSPAVWTIGKEFGTIGCKVDAGDASWIIEVTTYRSDVYAGHSRKPEVAFGDTLDGDLHRRDFTINAMAVSIPDKRFVDPYGG